MDDKIKQMKRVTFNNTAINNKHKSLKKEFVKEKTNNEKIAELLTQYTDKKQVEISAIELLNLFVNYRIPVCRETIETIQKYSSFIIKK